MIIDTSALITILRDEPETLRFLNAIETAETRRISAGNWIEFAAIDTRRFEAALHGSAIQFLRSAEIEIAPVTERQAAIGQEAYRRYGIGTRHPAGLNFGDCFAYALARETGEPLLFKGDDFIHTDIASAL